MCELGRYLAGSSEVWEETKRLAGEKNKWFTGEFIEIASQNLIHQFLQEDKLQAWAKQYNIGEENHPIRTVGIIMAGNIPMVGFHDLLSVFISGHRQKIKLSSKDDILMRHVSDWLIHKDPECRELIEISDNLKGCDAYIATGSGQSSRYFEFYFSKYPHIIRPSKTSVALLNGSENKEELEKLSDDIHLFFGLGCRNVTQLLLPREYDFQPLMEALGKYSRLRQHYAYGNNYDYRLAILLLDKSKFLQTDHLLITENESPFSPISMLHYRYYSDLSDSEAILQNSEGIQCVVGKGHTPFGEAQIPGLTDYADGVDTMEFLQSL
jgi:hypothetical protein